MSLRKLVMLAVLFAAPAARADVGLGGFFGNPTAIDLKLGLAPRSGLDLAIGWYSYRGVGDGGYGHVTYLVTPVVGRGDTVLVPLRLGIGGALFGTANDLDFGVRFPAEIGLRFRRAPLEIYGEVALLLAFVHPNYDFVDVQGGVGIRFYF